MKKSLLALLIVATFAITSCDDNVSQKLLETEKHLVQLQANHKKISSELATKEGEFEQLKSENEALKTQYDVLQKQVSGFPALQVEIAKLIEKEETLKLPKDPENEYAPEESKISVFVTVAKTQIDWLDQLLLTHLVNQYRSENEKPIEKITEQEAIARFETIYTNLVQDAKEYHASAMEISANTHYLGQRNNIATFSQYHYSFTGGAHGVGYEKYLNIDTNTKSLIKLDDVFSRKNQEKLKTLLWENYENARKSEQGSEPFIEKKDFRISEDFYFTPNGITFVYPVYELGSYAEGPITLETNYYQINALLNKGFKKTEKDGFFASEEE